MSDDQSTADGTGNDGNSLSTDRRRLLGALGTIGAGGLAGCGFLSSSSSNTPSTGGQSTSTQSQGTDAGTSTPGGTASTAVSARSLSNLPSGSCSQGSRTSQRSLESPRVESDTTLGTDADVILAPRGIRVAQGTTLTVQPGTTLAFGQGAGMRVGGTLEAAGSCSEPIVFTGETDRQGFWQGVAFATGATGTLEHVLVENGGSENGGALVLQSDGLVSLRNAEIRGAAGDAIAVGRQGRFADFATNALVENAGAPFRGPLAATAALDSGSVYGSSDDSPIAISVGTVPSGDQLSLSALGVPYEFGDGTTFLSVNGRLELAPGVAFNFGQGGQVTVSSSGELVADGSGGDPITFSGLQTTAGYWNGVLLNDSDSTANVLRNIELRDAGSEDGAALRIRGATRLTLENSHIENSANYGVRVAQAAQMDSFAGNTVTGTVEPVWVSAQVAHLVGADNDLTGNERDRLHVYAGEYDGHYVPEDADVTWSDPGVPLFLEKARGGCFTVYGTLTLEPGLELRFDQDNGIYVTGSMNATVPADAYDGETPDLEDPPDAFVTFRGQQATRGYWRGIGYSGTDDTNNVIDGAIVRHAGRTGMPEATYQQPAAVLAISGARLTVDNVLVEQNENYGLFVQRNNLVQSVSGRFRNNGQPAQVYLTVADVLDGDADYSGNDTDRCDVKTWNRDVGEAFTWTAINVPYRVLQPQSSTVSSINADAEVEDGTEIHFKSDGGLLIDTDGSLRTNGSTTDDGGRTTVFRGEQATPGFWRGIRFRETTDQNNVIDSAEIRHTGSRYWRFLGDVKTVVAVCSTNDASATVRNSLIADFRGHAFDYSGAETQDPSDDSVLNLSNNTIQQ